MEKNEIVEYIKNLYKNIGVVLYNYDSYRGLQDSGFYVKSGDSRIGGVSIGSREIEIFYDIANLVHAKITYNIGVAFGISCLAFALSNKFNFVIGIDNFSENNQSDPNHIKELAYNVFSKVPNIIIVEGTSPVINKIALKNIPDPLSIVFIDADHTEDAARNDFLGILPYLDKSSIVIWHDIDKIPITFENAIYDTELFDNKIKLLTWGRIGIYLNEIENSQLFNYLLQYQ